MKYVDMLFELGLITERIQLKIKYGTANVSVICLLRNGFSPDLAHMVLEEYSSHSRSQPSKKRSESPREFGCCDESG